MSSKPDFDQLYRTAEAQAGYFTSSQAGEASYSHERLSDLAARGKFRRIQRGLYRLAHFPATRYEDLMIAQLQTGPGSVISHESALGVYDLSDNLPARIHVNIPPTASRRRPGLVLHTQRLQADESTQREGLPITTPERTIADVIASGLPEELIRQAISQALQRGLVTEQSLRQQAQRRKGRVAAVIEQMLKELA